MTGEVTLVHDDGAVTVRLHGFGTPITTSGEHLALVVKRKAEPGRRKLLYDKPDWTARNRSMAGEEGGHAQRCW